MEKILTLLNPLNAVPEGFAIQANKLVQRGVSGIRKRFSRKNFIKVEWIALKDLTRSIRG